jgi:hypothetical protein
MVNSGDDGLMPSQRVPDQARLEWRARER